MTATVPYRSGVRSGGDGFAQLLHAEWTKFRTVRGWVIGMLLAALATIGFGLAVASGIQCSTGPFSGLPEALACTEPLGPGGEAVADRFYFVHQPLAGNGSLTIRVTSLAGGQGIQPWPWSKAGIIVKASLRAGSAYAAMMVTGQHGVRMQYDYTGDTAGLLGAVSAESPRWLRLTRAGDTLTGYDSADGSTWTRVGTVTLTGLPSTVQGGAVRHLPGARAASPERRQVRPWSQRGYRHFRPPRPGRGGRGHVDRYRCSRPARPAGGRAERISAVRRRVHGERVR